MREEVRGEEEEPAITKLGLVHVPRSARWCWRDRALDEHVVDVLRDVVVVSNTIRIKMILADTVRQSIEHARSDEVVALRAVLAAERINRGSKAVPREQLCKFVEADARYPGCVQEHPAIVRETGLNRIEIDWLQELSLKQLTVPRDPVTGQAR